MTRSANAVSTRALLGADAQNRFLSPLMNLRLSSWVSEDYAGRGGSCKESQGQHLPEREVQDPSNDQRRGQSNFMRT